MNLIIAQIGAWYYVLNNDVDPTLYVPVMLYATREEAAAYVAQFAPPPVEVPADDTTV